MSIHSPRKLKIVAFKWENSLNCNLREILFNELNGRNQVSITADQDYFLNFGRQTVSMEGDIYVRGLFFMPSKALETLGATDIFGFKFAQNYIYTFLFASLNENFMANHGVRTPKCESRKI